MFRTRSRWYIGKHRRYSLSPSVYYPYMPAGLALKKSCIRLLCDIIMLLSESSQAHGCQPNATAAIEQRTDVERGYMRITRSKWSGTESAYSKKRACEVKPAKSVGLAWCGAGAGLAASVASNFSRSANTSSSLLFIWRHTPAPLLCNMAQASRTATRTARARARRP
jgi:hypothetical protein